MTFIMPRQFDCTKTYLFISWQMARPKRGPIAWKKASRVPKADIRTNEIYSGCEMMMADDMSFRNIPKSIEQFVMLRICQARK